MKFLNLKNGKWLYYLFIISFLITADAKLFGWRSFSRYNLGADADGVGGAYVGDSSSEIAMNYNPAGLVQLDNNWIDSRLTTKSPSNHNCFLMYEVSSSVRILDILAWNVSFKFNYFPFFGIAYSLGKIKVGASVSTVFDSDGILSDLSVRSVKATFAYPLLDNLAIGFGIGPVIATESSGSGYSYDYNIGLLWKAFDKIQFGINYNSPINITWTKTIAGTSLKENYPFIAEIGMSYLVNDRLFFYSDFDYTDIDSIKYILDGNDYSPHFDNNIFSRLHPHLGIRFLEENTGAHISLGFMFNSSYYESGSVNQYLITAGIRAYGQNVIYRASIIDSLLFGLFYPDNIPNEQINVSFSFLL